MSTDATPPDTTPSAMPPAGGEVIAFAYDRPRRTARPRWLPFRRSGRAVDIDGRAADPSDAPETRAYRPGSQRAFVVAADFAVTTRAATLGDAEALARAAARVLPALMSGDGPRCHIDARGRGGRLPTLMIDCQAGGVQHLDTLLRCLESISGVPLRAKIVIHDGARPTIRNWVGSWIDPITPLPTRRPGGRRGGPGVSPAAA
jgi:hypothetical protein